MTEIQENNIEWYSGESAATVSFSQKKWISKIKKYASSHPEVEIVAQNNDGSICAHIPASWIKISPPRKGPEWTDEQKAAAAERLREYHQSKKNSDNN